MTFGGILFPKIWTFGSLDLSSQMIFIPRLLFQRGLKYPGLFLSSPFFFPQVKFYLFFSDPSAFLDFTYWTYSNYSYLSGRLFSPIILRLGIGVHNAMKGDGLQSISGYRARMIEECGTICNKVYQVIEIQTVFFWKNS